MHAGSLITNPLTLFTAIWISLIWITNIYAEDPSVTPLKNAHAHNDYNHPRPLLDAMDQGFQSVEADIFLVDDSLLVAHDLVDARPDKTLQSLYLDPLLKRTQQYEGKVYPNTDQPFILLIDLKSEGKSTYKQLHTVLASYGEMLTEFRDGETTQRAVTAIISGNRPRDLMESQPTRFAFYDGRLADLDDEANADFMPLISDHWGNNFSWRGEGDIPRDESEKLKDIVKRAHDRKQKIRFWATPDRASVWEVLNKSEVDLINTDNLTGLREFLTQKEASE